MIGRGMTSANQKDHWPSAPRLVLITLIAAVLVPRLLVVVFLIPGRSPEVYEYETIVHNLLAGKGYMLPHFGTEYFSYHSAYPYVLLTALVYQATNHSHVAMLLVQSVTSAMLVLVINSLGRLVGGLGVGWLAGALVALHPGLLYYDTHKLAPLSLDAFVLAAATLALCQLMIAPSIQRYAVAGFLSGFALLERGSFAPVMVISIVALFWIAKDRTSVIRGSLVFLLCCGILVAPWLVRNLLRHDAPVFMTVTGEHLWRGNNPNSTGSSLTRDGVPLIETADAEFRERLLTLDEIGQMRLFLETGGRYIIEHPWKFVWNVAKRLIYFAWFSPTTGILYPRLYLHVYQVYYVAMLLAAGLGLFHLGQRLRAGDRGTWITLGLLAAVWISVGLTQSIFYVEIRHRWGVEGLMLVMSASGIVLCAHLARTGWRGVSAGLSRV